MKLRGVTITGADDKTDITQMLALSAKFSFLEWGILVSKKHAGVPRFPSLNWIENFVIRAEANNSGYTPQSRRMPMKISTHICGEWVRQLFKGELDWQDIPMCLKISERAQINTHAEPHVSDVKMVKCFRKLDSIYHLPKKFIFQWDGVNDHIALALKEYDIPVEILFDLSGGAGILPETWPKPIGRTYCGYAGGLSPENLKEQLTKISKIDEGVMLANAIGFWVDMERRVRSEDDSILDMDKVNAVLEIARPFFL